MRQVSSEMGLYIRGRLFGVDLSFLIDTRATESFIAFRLLEKVDPGMGFELLPADHLFCQADGSVLHVVGRVGVQVNIKGTEVQHNMWVADISNDAILGLDFL